jgi:putative ABC transport system substrate-binding protein
MQNRAPSRLGFLSPVSPGPLFEAFRQGVADLGHHDGHELVIEARFAEGQYARFPALVAELVDLRMDVIAALGAVTVRAVKQVTSSIPIVFTIVVDPVADDVVASMDKPGGNATGVTTFDPTQAPKQLALLSDAIPALKRVALLSDQGVRKGLTKANVEQARALGLEIERIEIAGPTPDLEAAFATVRQAHADALLILEEPVVVLYRKQIVELAARDRLPTMISPAWADAGPLIAYGLRGLETQRFPPAGRLKAMGSDGPSVPVSTRLGRGAAHSTSKPVRRDLACRASTGVQSTHGTPGRRAQMLASGRRRMTMPSIGFDRAQSHRGVQLGSRLSRAPRTQSGAQASGHRDSSPPPPASDDCPAGFRDRLMPGVFGKGKMAAPFEIGACGGSARRVMSVRTAGMRHRGGRGQLAGVGRRKRTW